MKTLCDFYVYKSLKIENNWSGEEIQISKFTLLENQSYKKNAKKIKRINRILTVLNTASYDKLIWLKGWKSIVFFKVFVFFNFFYFREFLYGNMLKN